MLVSIEAALPAQGQTSWPYNNKRNSVWPSVELNAESIFDSGMSAMTPTLRGAFRYCTCFQAEHDEVGAVLWSQSASSLSWMTSAPTTPPPHVMDGSGAPPLR